MNKQIAFIIAGIVFCSFISYGQQVHGFVRDEQQRGLANVSVIIKKAKSGAIVKLSLTDTAGKYRFSQISAGKYFISVSHIGYQPAISDTVAISGTDSNIVIADIIPKKTIQELKEVKLVSTPPLIEMRSGKIILNVDASINSIGLNALEVLAKSPGVMVSREEAISISGKNGVNVYVNGKSIQLGGKDLSEFLKTIPSSQIQNIEIIMSPSAKYDAAGSAGIINIRLKKNDLVGLNGSTNAGYNIATFPRMNGNVNLNYRNSKFNAYCGYGFRHTTNRSFQDLRRELLDTLFDQQSIMTARNRSITHRTGIDFFLNPRHTVGVMLDGAFSDNKLDLNSSTPISYMPTGVTVKKLTADNFSSGKRNSYNINANYRFADKKNHELIIDANYSNFDISSDQYQPNIFYNQAGLAYQNNTYSIYSGNGIKIFNIKSDYEQDFMKGKLEVGAKSSIVTSDNDFQTNNVLSGGTVRDTSRSNFFRYKENINAVYASYNRAFKTWSYQLGLRVENTNSEGFLDGYRLQGSKFDAFDTTFVRHYTNPFPSASVTFNKNPKKQLSFSYSRRIDRPVYQIINPFESRLDEYSFQKGNPEIKPQYTHSLAATFMYKFKLVATLNYSHVTNMFTQLTDTTTRSKIFITYQNLAKQDITSINISYPFKYKKYSLFTSINSYYSRYKANFGTGRTIDIDAFVYSIYLQQGLQLSKTWYVQLTTAYNSPSVSQGTYRNSKTWNMDFGVQKSILKNRATLRAAVSDIFYTLQWESKSTFVGQTVKASGRSESRQLLLHFFFKFGSTKIKNPQLRRGADEESKRVKSD